MTFPKNFTWGAAAASYQVEGAAFEDGKGWSVWDEFCRREGAIANGETGDVACDHVHRYEEDARLMGELGLQAYRLSVSWPRVLPEGVGPVNDAGLDFYDRLVDALLAQRVRPWVTLFHWDFPLALERRGGWRNPESADWFAEYARVVTERLSDRVIHWFTQNEIQVFMNHGHRNGIHAPGHKLPLGEVLQAGHHALLAHGKAVQAIRGSAQAEPRVGAAPVGVVAIPHHEQEEDIAAARRNMFSVAGGDPWNNAWWADPMLLGRYPADGLEAYGADAPDIRQGDLETIAQPLDFYGANIYQGHIVRADGRDGVESVPGAVGAAHTDVEWPVRPRALHWGPKFLHERYGLPIVITENGMANADWVQLDGRVHDPQRIDFLTRYLRELRRATSDGVPVEGYFQWSILDNFERSQGYKRRFGLVYVDYETQQRIPKDSARWYSEVIRTHGANL